MTEKLHIVNESGELPPDENMAIAREALNAGNLELAAQHLGLALIMDANRPDTLFVLDQLISTAQDPTTLLSESDTGSGSNSGLCACRPPRARPGRFGCPPSRHNTSGGRLHRLGDRLDRKTFGQRPSLRRPDPPIPQQPIRRRPVSQWSTAEYRKRLEDTSPHRRDLP